MLFGRIFKELNAKRVKYLVVGGIAVNLYGFARATGDLDIVILLETENIKKMLSVIKHLKLKPRIPVNIEDLLDAGVRESWIREKNLKVFSLSDPTSPMEQVDILLEHDLDFKRAYEDREVVQAGTVKIPLVSLSDLIKMKNSVGRERDVIDVKALKKIRGLNGKCKK